MGNHKKVIKFFTIPQYQQEEEYLSSMHEKGWKLTKITFPCMYHFEQCEPKKVTYRLDYNQEGISNKAEYVQMFQDCGWNYLFDFVGYSYFCKEGNIGQEMEEIFCDDTSRIDMMKRVFQGRMLPLLILFLGVILPQLFLNTIGYGGGSVIQDVLSYCFFVLTILYLLLFVGMTYQFYQYEKKVFPEEGKVKYKYLGIMIFILVITVVIGFMFFFIKCQK